MYPLASPAQEMLVKELTPRFQSILVVDIQEMFETEEDYQTAMENEMAQAGVTKMFGKRIVRLFQRLLLHKVTIAAEGSLCPILIKLCQAIHSLDHEMIEEMWLIEPNISTKFVNTCLVEAGTTGAANCPLVQLNVISYKKSNTRLSILQHYFPNMGQELILAEKTDQVPNWFSMIHDRRIKDPTNDPPSEYDPYYCNELGKMLFLSVVKVEMNRHSKQYERICFEVTDDLLHVAEPEPQQAEEEPATEHIATADGNMDWSQCQRHIGALVLRGNRCVLVRSLSNQWKGMRIPSVLQQPNEAPTDAAIRAVVEQTEVEAEEMRPLPHILPVAVYAPNGRPILMELYPLYATQPPPDGPLEDADLEDDETPYDWYTFPNALKRLDKASIDGLHSMALNLVRAANVGLVPAKWGGVFGQELQLVQAQQSAFSPSLVALETSVEEWTPSQQGDMLQHVRKANQELEQRLGAGGKRSDKLPVTLLSGFLGSGKTTLLRHLLTNNQQLKVALLVNDMGEINIDAALIKSNGVSVRQRQEHMVSLDNGCICCTLREDLLVEVAKIAADPTFDYLLIESSGISEPMPVAETFTFEDSTGLRLGDVAQIDTLVTVVDGSKFMREMESLESLRTRNWHADPEDQRTISHLLCDQVEFANVIVLNKCDLMSKHDRIQVKTLISQMNPSARVVESEFSNVPLNAVLGTGLFSMADAEKHDGWLQEARTGEHTPETEEYGIQSFTYRAIRPFLPHKLSNVLQAMLEGSQAPFDKDNANQIIRAKGFVWLANCPQLQGEFSLAGNHYTLVPGNPWWAEIDKSHWPENLERDIAPLWHEPYGDRQQEFVVIGQSLDKDAIIQCLNECLVPADSMEDGGQPLWDRLVAEHGDPFQDDWDAAIAQAQEAGHDHSHEHSGHDQEHGACELGHDHGGNGKV